MTKQSPSNPFRAGDTVYHFRQGKSKVFSVDGGRVHCQGYGALASEFSFSPWPGPDHKRPLDAGVYVVQRSTNSLCIVLYRNAHGSWYYSDGDPCVADLKVLKYVCEDFESLTQQAPVCQN